MNIKTWTALAKLESVPINRLINWRHRDDWPLPEKIPARGFTKAHTKKLKAWREGLQADRTGMSASAKQHTPDTDPKLANITKRKQLEELEFTKLKREILAGKYIEVGLHHAAVRGVIETFIAEIGKALQKMPSVLVGLEPGEIEMELDLAMVEMRQSIADRGSVEIQRAADTASGKIKRPVGRPKQ